MRQIFSRFWNLGKISGTDQAHKVVPLVRSVAERLILRVATPANAHRRAASQPKLLPGLIDNFKIAFDSYRTIIEERYLCSGHEFLRKLTCPLFCRLEFQDSEGSNEIQQSRIQ